MIAATSIPLRTPAAESDGERERIEHIEIRVAASAAPHVGLGSGTQLAISVASALAGFIGRSDLKPKIGAIVKGASRCPILNPQLRYLTKITQISTQENCVCRERDACNSQVERTHAATIACGLI